MVADCVERDVLFDGVGKADVPCSLKWGCLALCGRADRAEDDVLFGGVGKRNDAGTPWSTAVGCRFYRMTLEIDREVELWKAGWLAGWTDNQGEG
eukprot:scaffold190829_cov23-Prasinocladus_malaysianus.AAC.1